MSIKEFNDIIRKVINEENLPGANYVIVTPRNKQFGCLGNKALVPEIEENNINTIYDLASMSKVISTTSCALKLIEQGKLRMFDAVQKYVPEFRHSNVRVYDLLTHTSGMKSYLPGAASLDNPEEVWNKIIELDLEYEKGTKILYSCINYIILGKVIERISGQTLDVFANEQIFKPLNMKDTCYNPTDIKRCAPTEERKDSVVNGILRGKVHDETAYALGGVSGNAGVFSTIEDISHFIEMILNDGVYKGKRIFSKATIDLIFTPQVKETSGVYLVEEQRSIGWIVKGAASSAGELASEETILHTGFTGTNIWIDRKNKIGFCMLSNRVHPSRATNPTISLRAKLANYIIAHLEEF